MAAVDGEKSRADEEFWIFGYGSLIWKPPPHYDQRLPGWVTGYVRRFWQASQDHRGTPEAPGRVVTLIERSFWASLADAHDAAPDRVWGVAYRIAPARVAEVKQYLDIREINGYSIHHTDFHPAPSPNPAFTTTTTSSSGEYDDGPGPIRTLVYIGTPDNDQFTGPQDPQALAAHIQRSEGPSGRNRDYLLSLEHALTHLSPESGDVHVSDLAGRLRAIETRKEAEGGGEAEKGGEEETSHGFRRVSSVDEQEETEKAV
ncbi:ChaC-like protein-domain-containing protein [Xylariomycetidae sp. FL0641]|nr:ChaC-like protein-domain-containing protein [Xylariomycetidae sp. FL0641]